MYEGAANLSFPSTPGQAAREQELARGLQKEIIWNEQAITTRTEDRAPVSTPDSVDIFILGS